jgi:hypothetical protein
MIIENLALSPIPGGGALDRFRDRLYTCLGRRADALSELADAVA